jgi:hypothetical protein
VVKSHFMEWLKTHREQQANEQLQAVHKDMQALYHVRALFARQSHNVRGGPVFDILLLAKVLLRKDVCNNLHTTMILSELQKTRQEYSQKYSSFAFTKQYTFRSTSTTWRRSTPRNGILTELQKKHNLTTSLDAIELT